MEWYLAVLKKYADFSGRARRKEYWMFTLFNGLIAFVLVMIAEIMIIAGAAAGHGKPEGGAMVLLVMGVSLLVLYAIYALAVLIPTIAVNVRRLHDTGRPGTYFFLGLIPLVGPIIMLVFHCEDSKPGPNAYGPNPKEIDIYDPTSRIANFQ